jgi:hypothetical protein
VCDRTGYSVISLSTLFIKHFPLKIDAAAAALIVIWFNLSHVYKLIMPANERKKDGNETKREMKIEKEKYLKF